MVAESTSASLEIGWSDQTLEVRVDVGTQASSGGLRFDHPRTPPACLVRVAALWCAPTHDGASGWTLTGPTLRSARFGEV
jgi:hypothetical protein